MKRKAGIIAGVILGCAVMLYLAGVLGQMLDNYSVWQAEGGIVGQAEINPVDWDLFSCFSSVFTASGLKSAALLLALTAAIAAYLKFGRFRDKDYDPRGFIDHYSQINAATASQAGVMTAADKVKLDTTHL